MYPTLNNDMNVIEMQYYYDNIRNRIAAIIMENPLKKISPLPIETREKLSNIYLSITLENANDYYDKYNIKLKDYVETRNLISSYYYDYKSKDADMIASNLLEKYLLLDLDNSNEILKEVTKNINICYYVMRKINHFCNHHRHHITQATLEVMLLYKKKLLLCNNEKQIKDIDDFINNELHRLDMCDLGVVSGVLVFIGLTIYFFHNKVY